MLGDSSCDLFILSYLTFPKGHVLSPSQKGQRSQNCFLVLFVLFWFGELDTGLFGIFVREGGIPSPDKVGPGTIVINEVITISPINGLMNG